MDEIIDMASKAPVADQQKQVQENIHLQIKSFCMSMDELLLPDVKKINEGIESSEQSNPAPRRSGLSFAIGRNTPSVRHHGEVFSFFLPILFISSQKFSESLNSTLTCIWYTFGLPRPVVKIVEV